MYWLIDIVATFILMYLSYRLGIKVGVDHSAKTFYGLLQEEKARELREEKA